MSTLLQKIQTHYVKPRYTEVKVGDTVRVYTRIKEGEKERTQYFEGLVIRRRGGIGTSATFTVRRIASGVGVERTFALHSPLIERIRIQRGAKVRRATLYTMRGLTGKAARLTEQPVKQADRERTHAWTDLFGIQPAAQSPDTAASGHKSTAVEADEPDASARDEKDTATAEVPAEPAPAKADKQVKTAAPGRDARQDEPDEAAPQTKASAGKVPESEPAGTAGEVPEPEKDKPTGS